jgi:hypothetical protein
MSESMQRTLNDSNEMRRQSERGSRLISATVAIVAVLAALGALFSHHRSISALHAKNQAILSQARSSDAYGKYEAKEVRAQVAETLIAAGVAQTREGKKALQDFADRERESSADVLSKAQRLEHQSEVEDVLSDRILKSYEMLEYATTFFDISIVLVSISALVRTRALFIFACVLCAIGVVLMIIGFKP